MRGLLAELSRRRVFRVAGLYGVVSWIIAEVSSVVFPVLLLPEWTVTFVVALLILGFPVAMILAWAYDIGPGGIEKTEPLRGAEDASGGRAWIAYSVMLAVAMAGLGYFLWWRMAEPERHEYESIAVMPFANLSGDEANDYFSDGMAEELLNLLAQVPGLQVAARTSSFAFKGQNVDVREVGRRLGVDAVLEGSVRKSGSQVRITAQLVDAQSGYHLWSETYDRELQDIFAVQDEISAEIVKALKGTLAAPQAEDGTAVVARTAPPTEDLDAYQLYLQGRHQWKRRGEEAVNRSIALFEQAVELDPGFARAWAGLAAAWIVLPGWRAEGAEPAGEGERSPVDKAVEAARRALALDPNLAEAHAVLAEVQSERWDWTGAEAAFFFATSIDPNDPTTRHWYSLLLCRAGRLDACLEQARLAFELDPASPVINYNLAVAYMIQGYDDLAVRYIRSAEELGLDTSGASAVPMMTALRAGDMETFSTIAMRQAVDGGIPEDVARLIVDTFGDRSLLPELLARFDEIGLPAESRAGFWLLAGETEQAIDDLVAAARARRGDLAILWSPEGRAVRQHPRFGEIAREAGLIEYWKQYGMPDDCRFVDDRLRCGFSAVAAAR
jgi:TolB-like protein